MRKTLAALLVLAMTGAAAPTAAAEIATSEPVEEVTGAPESLDDETLEPEPPEDEADSDPSLARASISGVITDPEGEPAPGVEVSVASGGWPEGADPDLESVVTDQDGFYIMEDQLVDDYMRYILDVRPEDSYHVGGYIAEDGTLVPDRRDAQEFLLGAGDVEGADAQLQEGGALEITVEGLSEGYQWGYEGNRDGEWILSDEDEGISENVHTIGGLREGDWEFWFWAHSTEQDEPAAHITPDQLEIEITPGQTTQAKLSVELTGAATADLVHSSGRTPQDGQVHIGPAGEESTESFSQSLSAGGLELPDLVAGSYDLIIITPLGATKVEDVVINAGEVTDLGEIELDAYATIEFSVLNTAGHPVHGAEVGVRWDWIGGWSYAETDEDGNLTAYYPETEWWWEESDEPNDERLVQYNVFHDDYDDVSGELEVIIGETFAETVELQGNAHFTLEVTHESNPVPERSIRLENAAHTWDSETDEDGIAAFEHIVEGNYRPWLVTRVDDGSEEMWDSWWEGSYQGESVDVSAGESSTSIELDPNYDITVQVTDENGDPLEEVEVRIELTEAREMLSTHLENSSRSVSFSGLAPNEYLVSARKDGSWVYYGQADDPAEATVVELSEDQKSRDVEIVVPAQEDGDIPEPGEPDPEEPEPGEPEEDPWPAEPTGGVDILVSDGDALVSGAYVGYVASDGTEVTAVTDASGIAILHGLPDGQATIAVWAAGYSAQTVVVDVVNGVAQYEVLLVGGETAASVLEHRRMTLEEIEEADIDLEDPENMHVYEAEIHLYFVAESEEEGEEGDEPQPGSSPVYRLWYWTYGDSDSDSEPGDQVLRYECIENCGSVAVPRPVVQVVGGAPIVQWLVIPVEASWLREMFEVSLVVMNLSPEEFTFSEGQATLELPRGLSLASMEGDEQLSAVEVPDIKGGSSHTATWYVRGDDEGQYHLSATYDAVVSPVLAPLSLTAETADPIHVWGASALEMSIIVDPDVDRWSPYGITVQVENVTEGANAASVYNLGFGLEDRPLDYAEERARYVWAPDQSTSLNVAELPPGETAELDLVLYPGVGSDQQERLELELESSFITHTGGNVDLAPQLIERDSSADRQSSSFSIARGEDGDVLLTNWGSMSDATRYEFYFRPSTLDSSMESWQLVGSTTTAGTPSNPAVIPDRVLEFGRHFTIVAQTEDGARAAYPLQSISGYTALGDSFSSGEGVPEFFPETATDIYGVVVEGELYPPDEVESIGEQLGGNRANTCHRSMGSYPELLARGQEAQSGGFQPETTLEDLSPVNNVTCSGAVTHDLDAENPRHFNEFNTPSFAEPAQFDALNSFSEVATITMGGNDIGFNDIASDCVRSNQRCDSALDDGFSDLHEGLVKDRLSEAFAKAMERAPHATIYAGTYPRFFDDSEGHQCIVIDPSTFEGGIGLGLGVGNIGEVQRKKLNAFVSQLNGSVEEAAEIANSEATDGGRIQVVDVGSYFAGHELCRGGSTSDDSALHPVFDADYGIGWSSGYESIAFSLHPNDHGQQLYAQAFADAIAATRTSELVAARGTSTTPVQVSESTRVLRISTQGLAPELQLSLVSPSGQVIDGSQPGSGHGGDGTSAPYIYVHSPEAGEWTIRIEDTVQSVSVSTLTSTLTPPAETTAVSGYARISIETITNGRPAPTAKGTVTSSGDGVFTFDASGSVNADRVEWLFMDGSRSTEVVVEREFSSDAEASATLFVYSSNGYSDGVDVWMTPPEQVDPLFDVLIEGSPTVGEELTASTIWGFIPDTVTFQWLRDGDFIDGATQETYVLTEEDAGANISVQVVASVLGYEGGVVEAEPLRISTLDGPDDPESPEPAPGAGETETATGEPSEYPTATQEPTEVPTESPSEEPSGEPTPTEDPDGDSTGTAVPAPSETDRPSQSGGPSGEPTPGEPSSGEPTSGPIETSSPDETGTPSSSPTDGASPSQSAAPTPSPTSSPSGTTPADSTTSPTGTAVPDPSEAVSPTRSGGPSGGPTATEDQLLTPTPSGSFVPELGDLEAELEGEITVPQSLPQGVTFSVNVGPENEGSEVQAWMFSEPTFLGYGTVAEGAVEFTIPADADIGEHTLALYSRTGEQIGWTVIEVVPAPEDDSTESETGAPASSAAPGATDEPTDGDEDTVLADAGEVLADRQGTADGQPAAGADESSDEPGAGSGGLASTGASAAVIAVLAGLLLLLGMIVTHRNSRVARR